MDTNPLTERLSKLLTLYRLFCLLAAFLVLGWLVFVFVAPNGRKVIRYNVTPDDPPAVLGAFASKEQARIVGMVGNGSSREYFQELTVDPVYFSVPAFRNWQKATVRLVYENPYYQPVIRLGAKVDGAYAFHFLATANEQLETLLPYWIPTRDGDLVLWQKNKEAYEAYHQKRRELERAAEQYQKLLSRLPEPRDSDEKEDGEASDASQGPVNVEQALKAFDFSSYLQGSLPYASVQDFLTKLPPLDRIIRFQYDLSDVVRVPGYVPSNTRTVSTKGLRGSHTIVAYVGEDEDLDFRFGLRDFNRHADDDRLRVKVTKGSTTVYEETVDDDGVHAANESVSEQRNYQLLLPAPGEGQYRIELKTTDDLFFTTIDSRQHHWYFDGHIYLTDNEEYRRVYPGKEFSPTRIVSAGSVVRARTSHTSALQTIRVGSVPLRLTELHKLHEVDSLGLTTTVTVPKNDVFLEGGSFAFSREQLFSATTATPASLEALPRPIDDYDFVIAQYPVKRTKNNLLVAETSIPASELVKHDGRYEFILSAPGLSENRRRLRLYELEVILERTPLTFSNLLPRLKNYFRSITGNRP